MRWENPSYILKKEKPAVMKGAGNLAKLARKYLSRHNGSSLRGIAYASGHQEIGIQSHPEALNNMKNIVAETISPGRLYATQVEMSRWDINCWQGTKPYQQLTQVITPTSRFPKNNRAHKRDRHLVPILLEESVDEIDLMNQSTMFELDTSQVRSTLVDVTEPESITEQMMSRWVGEFDTLFNPNSRRYMFAERWVDSFIDRADKAETLTKQSVNMFERDVAINTKVLAGIVFDFEPEQRPKILTQLFMVAMNYIDNPTSGLNITDPKFIIEPLKYLMLLTQAESDDYELFQLRMNLLQQMKWKNKLKSDIYGTDYELLADIEFLGGYIGAMSFARDLAYTEELAKRLGIDSECKPIYRVKSPEGKSDRNDTNAITLETDFHGFNSVMNKFQLLEVPKANAMFTGEPNSFEVVRFNRELNNEFISLTECDLEIDSVARGCFQIPHGESAKGGYDFILIRGHALLNGRDIPVEIQVVQEGEAEYYLNNNFEVDMGVRLESDSVSSVSKTQITNSQARFLSRLPYKQEGAVTLTPWVIFSDLIAISGPEPEDKQSFLSQYQILLELKSRLFVSSMYMTELDIRSFFRKNEALIDQLNVIHRWFLMMNIDEFGEVDVADKLIHGDFSDDIWQAPTSTYDLEYLAQICKELGKEVEYQNSERPYYPLSRIAFIGKGLFPNVEFSKLVAATQDLDFDQQPIREVATSMISDVVNGSFDKLRFASQGSVSELIEAQSGFVETIYLTRQLIGLKRLNKVLEERWNLFLDAFMDVAKSYLELEIPYEVQDTPLPL